MRLIPILAAAILASLALAPASMAQEADNRPIIKIGVATLPDGLDPGANVTNVGQRITYSVFDQLIKRAYWASDKGDGADLVPSIAAAWHNVSPTEWDVDIQPGLKFQDGEPVTAEDVAFTFSQDHMWGAKRQVPTGPTYFPTLKDVTVVDDHTVKFTTSAPDPIFPKRFTSPLGMVLPKNYYQKVGPEGFNRAPIGTGPYKVIEFKPHEIIKLAANDNYFGGKPPAKEIWFMEIPEAATRISGLLSGELDVITDVTPDQRSTIEGAQGFSVKPALIDNNRIIQLNTNAPPMNNVNLRRALVAAIDRQAIVKALWGGASVVPHLMNVPAHGDLYMPDRPITPYDPAEAKKLLAQSHYAGETLHFRILAGYYTNYLEAAQIMQQMWKEAGINVELEPRDSFATLKQGTWDMASASEGIQINDASQPITGNYGRTSNLVNPKSGDYMWSPPKELFDLIDSVNSSMDEAKRKADFTKALDIVEDRVPEIELFQTVEFYAIRDGLNWKPYSFWPMDFSARNLKIEK
ncbi:MAG TPA: ABC transporter substrate-binding protein [Devosia sp.]|nr:ABC transporter substrate-binding protein [Devosia sp.]